MTEKMKILVGYDGTNGADLALDDLRRAGLPREAEALVVSVAEPSFVLSGPGSLEMIIARDSIFGMEKARTLAEKAVELIRSDFPDWRVEEAVVLGSPSEALIVKADERGADLLVVGSHGHTALGRFFLGSVSQSVVAHARCSARVARLFPHKQMADPGSPVRIIVGIDGSPGAEAAVREVASRQWPEDSEACVVKGLWVIQPVSEEVEMHERVAMQAAEWIARVKPVAEEIVGSAVEQLKAAGLSTTSIIKVEEPKRLLLSEAERWDVEERVRSINHVAAELTGWPEEEAVGRPVSEVFNIINEDRTPVEDMPVTKAIREGVFTGNIKFILITKTGLEIPVEDGAAPIRDEKGQITGAVVVFRDIREQRRHEEERERSLAREQAMRAEAERLLRFKDEFLATLSHELRTPLNMISGWTQHLQRGNLDADGAARALESIRRNIHAQTQIIDDLLDVSAIIMGKLRLSMQIVDADDRLREALQAARPAAEAKGIELEYLPDPGEVFVLADPARLQQIAWNLLSNAIKFADRGGRVKLRLRRDGGQIVISVSDTGCGIAPEFLSHVFDRFSQADGSTVRTHGGLGLGLAIVRYLTEMHGGVVEAESAGAGCGATFTVRLPAATNPREAESGGRYSGLGHDAILEGLKVLLVDDDVEACQLFEMMLSQCSAQVTCVNSGSEALARLDSERPDLLIFDIAMPGLDGYELLARVRARGINIPAIALTAYARTADRIRALAAGFQSHVSKPVEADELVMAAASLCGRLNQAPRG